MVDDRKEAPTRPRANFCPWCGHPAGGQDQCAQCERPLVDTRMGSTIDGRYRIESLLGQGGMGRVYKATHLGIGEAVVLKFLLAQHARSPDQRARFKREAVALARLRHPGIVAVHDFGESEGAPYIVMELIKGRPLTALIGPHHELELGRLGTLFDQVLQVLEAAHGMNIVHRDLKPDNVMILEAGDRAEHVKVLDFGLAQVIDPGDKERLTMPGAVFGTPWYMSPEQCNGESVGPPTDIYAVGVMIYEALAGQCPFDGQSTAQVMAQQLYAQPPSLSEKGLSRVLPPGLEALVMRSISKRPEERPSARELRDQLAAALEGKDATARAQGEVDERVRYGTLDREQRVLPPHRPDAGATTQPDRPAPRPAAGRAATRCGRRWR
jgi:serine/threonine protein kinase